MADTDNRRDHRGHGGGHPGGRDRKRKRHGDEDDFDNGRRQRARVDIPPGTRIRRGLLEIGEDAAPNMAPRSAQSVAEQVAKLAADNWSDDFVKDIFCSVASKLVVEQPLKIPYVAATVLFANAQDAEIGALFLNRFIPQVQEAINAGEWRDFKLLLRFLACLGPMFAQDGVMPILDELFNRAADLQTESQEDVVGIELVKIILLTIPYLVAFSTDSSMHQRAAELLEKTDIVASTPHPLEPLVDPYPSDNSDTRPMPCASLISLLQKQLQEESTTGWKLACIPRLTANSQSNGDANGSEKTHSFPGLEIPASINAGPKLLFPEVFFSLFADQDIETVPPTSNIAASLMRDTVADTLNILEYNRNIAAKLLKEHDNFWSPGLFAKRGLNLDKLKNLESGEPTWKSEDIAVDAIFSQIFRLPSAEHKLVYYHSLITELCKLSPSAIAPSLGRGIRFLYRNVHLMDLELAYRFLDWFAHHLSNFEFRWKWQEWAPEVDITKIHPKKAFIDSVIDKEIRLSFAKRIRETLPDNFQKLVPASKEKDIPDFKYAKDTTPYAVEGRKILALLKKKAPEDEIQAVIDAVHEQATAHGTDPLVASTDIYMTAICSIGAKSLSHIVSTIDRCRERLLEVGQQSEPARRQIISAVVDFWVDQPGNAVNLIDKLLNYTIITPMSVIEWALRDRLDHGRALASSQVYELVSMTMNKMTDRLRGVVQQRNSPAVPFHERKQIDEVLPLERQSLRDLFTAIDDAVEAVATGASDEMIERYDGDNEEQDLIVIWGRRWARVWRRKAAVEETVVGEAAIEPLIEPVEEHDGAAEQGMDTVDEDIL
ncbi:hypothetical protein AMS68_004114 [Peltaster fructicola]|uniref:MIF4G domain-containing protein n=1 Tax=Peltaster fructicola TaxID=286661 RepID=A0A6H0XV12_9PEZI|nr:hypothetical protein AMS68_004114 [Peltaster fructicola]